MLKYLNVLLIACVCFFAACNSITKERHLWIDFSSDSTTVLISGMSEKSLAYLKNNLETDSSYKNLVSVMQVPNEDDSVGREIPIAGVLKMRGDSLEFKPKRSFLKGNSYLIQTMVGAQFGVGSDILTSNVGDHVKAQQQLLKR